MTQSDPASQADFKARAKMMGLSRELDLLARETNPPVFGTNQQALESMGTFDSGGGCPVTFGEPTVMSGGGGGPVLCEITGSSGVGYSCTCYRLSNGEKSKDSWKGTLVIPGLALGAKLPAGTQVLGYPAALSVTAMEK